MRKPSVTCALLAAMVAKHRWGSPVGADHLLAVAAVKSHEYDQAREAFERLRRASYIKNRGKRGIELDTSAFGKLADVLYQDCGWEPFHIRSRLKHYEGWGDHDWA